MVQTIADSIQQGRPFASLPIEALIALLRTADLVGDVVRRELATDNLSLEQYNVLRILRGAGEAGLRTYEVVPRMVSRAPNITRLVDKLEEKELLVRTRSRTDRRAIRLNISRAGRELIDQLDGRVEAAGADAMRGLPSSDLRMLVDLLDRLRDPLEDECHGATRNRSLATNRRGTKP
jgi:DNA-binding MarR family transcriptional regulator